MTTAKTALGKTKVPVFYREKLATNSTDINTFGMEMKPLSEVSPQMFSVKGSKGIGYDGVRIINKKYAGQTYNLSGDLAKKYPNGVKFTNDGFPDFSPYSKAKVKIDGLKGNTSSDFTAANKAMGLKSTPSGYTWHHVEDGRTLMLVPTDLHQAVRHTGGAALIRKGLAP
ncbi:HNH endonuclease [Cerasibacillus terrae]|nr:HNH endonuclease [Cerasibacillus terrae]